MTTRIASMAYLSSLPGMRRLAFADARHAVSGVALARVLERFCVRAQSGSIWCSG